MEPKVKFGEKLPTFKEVTGVKDGCFLDKDGNPISEEVADLMRVMQDAGLE